MIRVVTRISTAPMPSAKGMYHHPRTSCIGCTFAATMPAARLCGVGRHMPMAEGKNGFARALRIMPAPVR